MNLLRKLAFALVAACVVLTAAACSKKNNGNNVAVTTGANIAIRFVHGSPDTGAVDVSVAPSTTSNQYCSASNLPAKQTAVTLNYRQISGFLQFQSGVQYCIAFYAAGTNTVLVNPASQTQSIYTLTPQPGGNRYSVALTGRSAATGSLGLSAAFFYEPTSYTTNSGTWGVTWHHASPNLASQLSSVGIGIVTQASPSPTPSPGTSPAPIATPTYVFQGQIAYGGGQPLTNSVSAIVNQTATTVPTGFVVATSANSNTIPLAFAFPGVVPSWVPVGFPATAGIDPANTQNALPFGNNDIYASLYLIDSLTNPSGAEIIGTFANS